MDGWEGDTTQRDDAGREICTYIQPGTQPASELDKYYCTCTVRTAVRQKPRPLPSAARRCNPNIPSPIPQKFPPTPSLPPPSTHIASHRIVLASPNRDIPPSPSGSASPSASPSLPLLGAPDAADRREDRREGGRAALTDQTVSLLVSLYAVLPSQSGCARMGSVASGRKLARPRPHLPSMCVLLGEKDRKRATAIATATAIVQ